MIDHLIADDIAGLSRLIEASEAKSLNGIMDLAMRRVPTCCAATLTVWRDGTPDDPVGTHPDVVGLVEALLALGEGPVLDAMRERRAVGCTDTLTEPRWPRYRKLALRTGVRSSITGVEPINESLITLTLWAVRPGAFGPDEPALSALLANQARAVVTNLVMFEDAQRTATQLHQAASARALVDQAKGVLMQAFGCNPETAFEQLREESQRTSLKVVDVARKVIESTHLPDASAKGAGPTR